MSMRVRYKEITCKSVLGNYDVLSTRFWTRHSFDPYNNCEFDCVYCNSRTTRGTESLRNFNTRVYAKVNAPLVLAKELPRLKRKGVVSMGVAIDPYQPAEKKYCITKQILEILEEHRCPFAIGTKSDLVLRDLDLISKASKKSHCCISLSITTLDEKLARLLEPNAPSPKTRLEVLRRFSDEGITTGVWLAPIVPYLTDNNQNIASIVEAAVKNGARFILGGALDTRNNVQFKTFLKENFAQLLPRYERLYKGKNGPCTYYPAEFYLYNVYTRFISLCQRSGVENCIPHFHTRKQALLFYVRNFSPFRDAPVFGLTQLLNYLPPSQECLQTIQLKFGNWSIGRGFLNTLHYFPH